MGFILNVFEGGEIICQVHFYKLMLFQIDPSVLAFYFVRRKSGNHTFTGCEWECSFTLLLSPWPPTPIPRMNFYSLADLTQHKHIFLKAHDVSLCICLPSYLPSLRTWDQEANEALSKRIIFSQINSYSFSKSGRNPGQHFTMPRLLQLLFQLQENIFKEIESAADFNLAFIARLKNSLASLGAFKVLLKEQDSELVHSLFAAFIKTMQWNK